MKRSGRFFYKLLGVGLLVLLAAQLMASESRREQQLDPKAGTASLSSDQSLVEVASRIQQVVVYLDRAHIVRKGEIKPSPETRSLVFRGLPGTIIPGSVRVAASATSPVKILGVEVSREFLEVEQLPEVRRVLEEIDSVEGELARIKGKETILEAQEKFLNSFGTAFSHQASGELLAGRSDLSGVDKFVDYLGARLQSIQKSRQDNARALKEKQSRLEALKKKLKEITPAGSKEQQNIRVLVESLRPTELQVELSYDVSPASWKPVYTIKALPESGQIELNLAATIKQKTGENWDNVSLLLSTSRPTAGSQPGELSPWYLDFLQPRLLRAAGHDLAEDKVAIEMEAAPALEETAETVETWLGANFEIKKPWSIVSDGVERRVPIDSQKIPAVFDYLAIPKLQELCFLRSSFKNIQSYPWLRGQADLFIDQDFLGSLRLNLIPAGEELQLFFGEDNQLRVKRELIKREKSAPGFLGKNERINQVYRITVENHRNRPVEIEVKDQLPVSQNTKIEIKDVKIIPAPSSRDERGILTWNLKLEPRQKQEIILDFSVEYPKGSRIMGI